MDILIGVDAGGTKTETVAYRPDGALLERRLTGFGNLLNGPGEACAHIVEGIRACVPESAAPRVYVGAAGITAGDNKAMLHRAISEAFPAASIRIETDTHLALYAHFRGEDGMILIAGTGSMAYAKRGKDCYRFGGWGQLLADQGSGYDIVHQAFLRMVHEFDYRIPHGALSYRLLEAIDADFYGAVKFFHSVTKDQIAALLPVLVAVAEQGDKSALSLLLDAGDTLAGMACGLYRTAAFSGRVELVPKGSVLEKVALVRARFEEALAKGSGDFALRAGEESPTLGAVYLYREERG